MTMSAGLHEPNVDKHDHEAAGLGRSSANPRWGPHFRDGELREDVGDDAHEVA